MLSAELKANSQADNTYWDLHYLGEKHGHFHLWNYKLSLKFRAKIEE